MSIEQSTPENYKKALESEDWMQKHIKDRSKLKAKYNFFLSKIKEEDQKEQLRLYQLAKERLLQDKRSHRIDEDFANSALEQVRGAISRITGEPISNDYQVKQTDKNENNFSGGVMPHQDVIDNKFMELKKKHKVSTAFDMLKSELIDNKFEPSVYGLHNDPDNFNRAVNKRREKALKNQ